MNKLTKSLEIASLITKRELMIARCDNISDYVKIIPELNKLDKSIFELAKD